MAIKPSGDEPPKWSLLNNKICQDSAPASPGAQQQRSQVLRVRGGGMPASDWSASHPYSPLIGCWETQCSTGSDWAESRETWVQTQSVPARAGWYRPILASYWPHRSQSWPLIGWWRDTGLWSDTDTQTQVPATDCLGGGSAQRRIYISHQEGLVTSYQLNTVPYSTSINTYATDQAQICLCEVSRGCALHVMSGLWPDILSQFMPS